MSPTYDFTLPKNPTPTRRPGTFPLPPPPNDWYVLKKAADATEAALRALIATKQNTLVSGENIKTINGQTILGSGNLDVSYFANWETIINKPKCEIEDLPETFTEDEMRTKLNSLLGWMRTNFAVLTGCVLMASGAFAEPQVLTAQKGSIRNTENIVTNVTGLIDAIAISGDNSRKFNWKSDGKSVVFTNYVGNEIVKIGDTGIDVGSTSIGNTTINVDGLSVYYPNNFFIGGILFNTYLYAGEWNNGNNNFLRRNDFPSVVKGVIYEDGTITNVAQILSAANTNAQTTVTNIINNHATLVKYDVNKSPGRRVRYGDNGYVTASDVGAISSSLQNNFVRNDKQSQSISSSTDTSLTLSKNHVSVDDYYNTVFGSKNPISNTYELRDVSYYGTLKSAWLSWAPDPNDDSKDVFSFSFEADTEWGLHEGHEEGDVRTKWSTVMKVPYRNNQDIEGDIVLSSTIGDYLVSVTNGFIDANTATTIVASASVTNAGAVADAAAKYLPLTGGTVNGILTITPYLRVTDLDGRELVATGNRFLRHGEKDEDSDYEFITDYDGEESLYSALKVDGTAVATSNMVESVIGSKGYLPIIAPDEDDICFKWIYDMADMVVTEYPDSQERIGFVPYMARIIKYNEDGKKFYVEVQDKEGTLALTSDIPTKTSELTNDSGFITNAQETDPVWNDEKANYLTIKKPLNHDVAFGWSDTDSVDEVVTSYYDIKGIGFNAYERCLVKYDDEGEMYFAEVQDKDGTLALTSDISWGNVSGKPTFASVATSGSYNDLSDTPTIPAAQIQSDWNQTNTGAKDYIKNKPTIPAAQIQSNWNETDTSSKSYIQNKPTLASVATSGSYNDLSDKPDIGSVAVTAVSNSSELWSQTNTKLTNTIVGVNLNYLTNANSRAWSATAIDNSVIKRIDNLEAEIVGVNALLETALGGNN